MKTINSYKKKISKYQLIRIFSIFITTFLIIICSNLFVANYSSYAQEKAAAFPVVFDHKTLFTIQQPSGSFSAEERADTIQDRLVKIADNTSIEINENLFDIDDTETSTLILFNRKILATVTEDDAKALNSSRQDLAKKYLKTIQTALKQYRREKQPFYWVFGIIATLVTSLLLFLTLKLFDIIFPYFYRLLDSWRGTIIPSIRLQSLELLSSDRLTNTFQTIIKFIRTILTLLILYAFIPVVLSFFPKTRQIGTLLFDYLFRAINLVGKSFVSYLPSLFIVVIIIVLTHYTLRFLKFIFEEIENGNLSFTGFYPEWAQPTHRLLTWLTIALAAVFAFPYLPGFNSPAFQGVSAFLALLFTLGATGVVANTVSGFVLIYTRAFQVADRVQIGDAVGDILEKTLLVTRIRTIKNVVITIPNSVIINSNVINFSALARDLNRPLILHTTITLGYDAPWREVHQALIKAAKATQDILSNPPPFVLQTALSDFYVSYEINAYTNESLKMAEIYSELHQNIQDKCNEADIEILSPHYSALRDGNHTTIPTNYLSKDYTAPGFKVESSNNLLNGNE